MRNAFLLCVILSSLLMQACSTTSVVTTIVPGTELSKTSLGERELENRVVMDEVKPLSVKLYRRVSTVEYTKTEYKAVKETRHEKTTYDCRNAYDRYIGFMLTTMAVPLLYEMVTGFDILREKCEKNPPTFFIEKADTDKILTRESFDKEKIVTTYTPLAGEPVTVEIAGNKYSLSTSKDGIATFPAKELDSLNNGERSVSIDYQYNDVRLATPFRKPAPEEELKTAKRSAKSKSTSKADSDDPSASSGNDLSESDSSLRRSGLSQSKSDSMAILGEQSSAKMAAKKSDSEPLSSTDPKINALSRKMNANANNPPVDEDLEQAKTADSKEKEKSDSMAMIGEQSAALKSAKENKRVGQENAPSNMNKIARQMNKSRGGYTNEDENIKITQSGKSLKIRNKSDLALVVKRVSVNYNGRVIENVLSEPVVIPPKSDSSELNQGNLIGGDFDDIMSFGVAASYQLKKSTAERSTVKVDRYTDNKVSEDVEESARMRAALAGMAAKASAAASDEALVSIGAEKSTDNSAQEEWKIVLNIKFDTNKTTIRKEYYPRLKEIGETLKDNPGLKGVIEGHTDSVGSKELNQKISIRRAEAVANHLITEFGISADRLKIEGFGMSRPIADNSTPKGRALNRRIEAKFKELEPRMDVPGDIKQ